MKQFAAKSARPLPVIILADVSGSMSENDKIGMLNRAIKEMLQTFTKESRLNAEIQVALITFGGKGAIAHVPLAPAHQIQSFQELTADGGTPMGDAFKEVTKLLEDKDVIPSRAYRPTLVLISDGQPDPDSDWESELEKLRTSDRAQKATRMAMAIGDDADEQMMAKFINNPEIPLFKAHNALDVGRFFRAVSMSVTSRSRSATPNQPIEISYEDIPDDDLDLDDLVFKK